MKKKCSDGFRPKQVCKFLEIKNSTLRYWRENLDPDPKHELFSYVDIFKYRVLKHFIYYNGVRVNLLKQTDCSIIFHHLNELRYDEFNRYIITYNFKNSKLGLINREDDAKYIEALLRKIYLDLLVEEQTEALYAYANPTKKIIVFRKRHKNRFINQ